MTIHYHGTPITPKSKLYEISGRHFCVSFAHPQDVLVCHQIGQTVMIDNGAYSAWTMGKKPNWYAYYEWVDRWLQYPTTWAVIPDVIEADEDEQDYLISQWPHGHRGAPVWHMHEDINRLVRLTEEWGMVCIGSSKEYRVVLSPSWKRRMDAAWNAIARRHRRTPWVHMLRGMATVTCDWPFASVDSTDIARNHNRPHNSPRSMAERWDKMQCPGAWEIIPLQKELVT